MPKMVIFGTIKALHDLFTALWIGGLLTTALTFMPVFRKFSTKQNPQKDLLKSYQNRLSTLALISIVGLWVTGLFLGKQSPAYAGFLSFATTYQVLLSVKHIVILLMVVIALVRRYALGGKIDQFTPQQQKTYAALLLVNTIFGVVVLFLSGIGAAFG